MINNLLKIVVALLLATSAAHAQCSATAPQNCKPVPVYQGVQGWNGVLGGPWTTATRPSASSPPSPTKWNAAWPPVGLTGFNTTIGLYETWNGSAWIQSPQASGNTITAPSGVTVTLPPSSDTLPGLNTVQAWSAGQFFQNYINVGTGQNSPNLSIDGAAGQTRTLRFATSGGSRWSEIVSNDPETGGNAGSLFNMGVYGDNQSFLGFLYQASRGSGPSNAGPPYFSNFSPWLQGAEANAGPGGEGGNVQAFTNGDAQNPITLSSNPITTNGTSTVTVNFTNASSQFSVAVDTWVLFTGLTSVGGQTFNGTWLHVTGVSANSFTFLWTGTTPTSATGGGTVATVQPSYPVTTNKSYAKVTTGASGFSVKDIQICDAFPLFYQQGASGPTYLCQWDIVQSPPDSSNLNTFGTGYAEFDFINRNGDKGYPNDPFTARNPTIGLWGGATPTIIGNQTAYNWGTVWGVFSKQGNGLFDYQGYLIAPNALVPKALDTQTNHGGVGYDVFGSYQLLGSSPFTTTNASSVVTVQTGDPTGTNQMANGQAVMFPSSYTINGVTFGGIGNKYVISNLNQTSGTFTITGTGSGTAGTGGGAGQILIAAVLEPYSVSQAQGGWTHGYNCASNFFAEDGLCVSAYPGSGFGWYDGTAISSINTAEVSPGVMDLMLNPGGSGRVVAKGPLALPRYTIASGASQIPSCTSTLLGTVSFVTDYSGTPTYHGAIGSGGGTTGTPVFCNGSAWLTD